MPASPAERRISASLAAHESWAATTDRADRTEAARKALSDRFLAEAGGDPQRADHLRKAHFKRLALASARNRRMAREATEAAEKAEAELSAPSGDQS